MRNLFLKRQAENKYDDWLAPVDDQTKTAQDAKQNRKEATLQPNPLVAFVDKRMNILICNCFIAIDANQTDGINPIKFINASDTMKKKMEMLINKRLEKGHEQIRARTPQTAIKLKY